MGTPPSRAILAALAEQALTVDRGAPEDLPHVVSSVSGRRVPSPDLPRGRWVWLTTARPPDAQVADAILRGAYDVIWAGAADAPPV
jgi:hypothetical protein